MLKSDRSKQTSALPVMDIGAPDGLYEGLRAMTIQNYTEVNVKNGYQYELSNYQANFAGLSTADFVLTTGPNPVSIKGLSWQFDGLGFSYTIYSGPTFTGGTPIPYFNKNNINPVAGTVVILGGVTVSNAGTQISSQKYFLGSDPAGNSITSTALSEAAGLETVLAPNTNYLFRRVSIDNGPQRVGSYVTWYEGGLDLPL